MIVGLQIERERTRHGLLEDLSATLVPGPNDAILGEFLANRLQVKPGDTIAVIGQDSDGQPLAELFPVKAVVRSKTEVLNRTGVVIPLATAQELLFLPDAAHEIVVYGKDPDRSDELATAVAALPGMKDCEVLPWRKAVPELAGMLDMKSVFDLIFVGIFLIAAAAGIANTMMMSAYERTREFGMLLAVGMPPRRVVSMIVIEALMLGLIGVAVGSVLATATVLVTGYTGLDYSALSGVKAEDIVYKGLSFSYILHPIFEEIGRAHV